MEIENQISEIIGQFSKKAEWTKMQKALYPFVIKRNPHPLFLINYAIALYYNNSYREALKYSKKAYVKDENDPFIIYHHAIILMCNKKFNNALQMFKKVASFSEYFLIKSKYGGNKKWAKSLVNDTIYYMAKTYFYKNDLSTSIKYYKLHLKKRKRGIASLITKREVRKELEGTIFLKNYELKYPEKAKPILT